ncbi:MAG: hypothetical protein QM718_12030 [Steroidobacteraceae bacterium]
MGNRRLSNPGDLWAGLAGVPLTQVLVLSLARLKDPAARVLLAAQLPTLPAEMLSTGSVDAVIAAAQASLLMRSGAAGV